MWLAPLVALSLQAFPTSPPAAETPAASEAPRVERDVVYRVVDGLELRLDAYLPSGQGPHPALLLVHGGGWKRGKRRDMGPIAERLAGRGYACFAPDYRLAPEHRFPAQLEDCAAALRFVRVEAGRFEVDPTRVGGLGLSAGAHLVELLGVLDERAEPEATEPLRRASTRLQAVVGFFGPSLLTRTKELDFDTRSPEGFLPEVDGVTPDEVFRDASPVSFVSADDPPFLLLHGDADPVVPLGHSRLLETKLRAAGVPCELRVIPGGGHGDFFASFPDGDFWRATEAFLDARLGPGSKR